MAEFPRYQSKGALTTQVPSVGAVGDTKGQQTEAIGKVGQTVQDTSIKWVNALDTVQKTTATANFRTGLAEIQQRAQNDPNYNNSDQYMKEIEKLRTDNLKGFASKTAETETALNFGYESKVAGIQIGNIYKKKMIDVGQASTLSLIDNETSNPTPNSLSNIKSLLNTQVQAGIIGHTAAYKLQEKANNDLGVNRISKDLNQAKTPEDVDAIKQAITSGGYEQGGVTIDPKKKESLLKIANTAEKNAEKRVSAQEAEALVQNRMETITGLASGKIQSENLNLTDIAEYDPQLANTLSKVKDFLVNYNPKLSPEEQQNPLNSAALATPSEKTRMRNYAKSITDTFLQNDNQKLGDFVLRELEKKGDGLTPSIKLAAFVNLAALKSKVNNQQQAPDAEAAARFNSIKAGVKFLQASNPYLAGDAISEFVVKNYLSGSTNEKKVMEEARAVLKDKILDRHQSVAKLPSLPNKIVDGESSVEDLQSGNNDLKDGTFSGDYADTNSD